MGFLDDKLGKLDSGKKLSKDEVLRRIPLYLVITVAASVALTFGLQALLTAAVGGGSL